jgi:phosphoglycolate phosphatase
VTRPMNLPDPPVVGFDLDLTLVDTRHATGYALGVVNQELGERIDVDAFLAQLGLPIRDELRRWVARDRIDAAVARFRSAFIGDGLRYLRPTSAAQAVLDAIANRGGRAVVITSRRPEIAAAALHAVGLVATAVVGGLTGEGKAPAMVEHGITCYVGDHPLDMAGARAARVPGVAVLTGNHNEAQLRRAGATLVVDSLAELLPLLHPGTDTTREVGL